MEDINVNGTLIWYYYICKREVWLMSRSITGDQDNKYMDIGRFIHESSYSRDKKEISIGNIKIDILKKNKGNVLIGEVKKSSKYEESAKMQLAYYLYKLKEYGVEGQGVLMFPKERKRVEIVLDEDMINKIKYVEKEILKLIYDEYPLLPKKTRYCRNCAYSEFCWS
ncbi:CRISPR-associated protein Cas4 [Clostridium sp. D2Q-14]|uniref:CRISPR-associated protein Cas4 n=1 Tax=Anaeromonas gelatinilytica TaxID=2683194 RepID=UPI00193BC6EC|nr:CRISPR-associated protein Cas4 [Anaeromonas gelatinilytica]MBS4535593.1 CRISPR-associated protein Cas4 [Anaeromonas gelatinilytica]